MRTSTVVRGTIVAGALIASSLGMIAAGGAVSAQAEPDPTTTTTEVDETTTTTEVDETTTTTEGEETSTTEGGGDEVELYALDVSNDECLVTFVSSIVEAGSYAIEVWDDGDLIDTVPFEAASNGRYTSTYTVIADPMQEALGLGFILVDEDGNSIAEVDPYDVLACRAKPSDGETSGENAPAAPGAGAISASPSYTG